MRRRRLFEASVTVLLAVKGATGQPPQSEAMARASTVFVGTVLEVGAVSFPGVPRSPRTMVVRVDQILEKPTAIALAAGSQVTVEAIDPAPFRSGLQVTFYAEGWILGAGVALREVAHEIAREPLPPGAVTEKRAQLTQARRDLSDANLTARIRDAEMVVVGRVVSIQPATVAARGGGSRVTEHDPSWQEAVIRVENGIKGARANQQVVVRFPKSRDVAWHGAPKFIQGQEGTFILKKDEVSGTPTARLAGAEVAAYTALGAEDVLPKDAAERVRALAERRQ